MTKTLSPHISESVIYVEEAKELWDELKERFSKGDYFKISDLLQDIHSIKQGERGVNQFFTDLKILWEELESLRPIPVCTCEIPCNCDLSKVSLKYREMKHVICFLKGLNDSYNTVKTQILLMDPLPNVNRVFSFIIQQERQEKQSNTDSRILVNMAKRNNQWKPDQSWRNQGRATGIRGQGRGRGRNPNYGKQCSYCNKMNHTVDECYSKHEYPPWYKKEDKKSDWNSVNAFQNNNQNNNDSESILKTQHQINNNCNPNLFTPEQMQKLLKMIEKTEESSIHKINQVQRQETENKPGNSSWVIDTGATDHVTHDKTNFTIFYKIKPITITLPNKTVITTEYAGTIRFTENFILFNVLYIPNFCFNLISVQSLIKDLNCNLIFSYENCQIRENRSLKTIGYAKPWNGLYYLQDFPKPEQRDIDKAVFSFKKTDVNLWHLRLRHPGHHVVKRICEMFPYVKIKTDIQSPESKEDADEFFTDLSKDYYPTYEDQHDELEDINQDEELDNFTTTNDNQENYRHRRPERTRKTPAYLEDYVHQGNIQNTS
ncbi:uncharacterized protein LOC111241069 [Vigna radiata var. radiata]|uniref:Uncharacterized protein LOC111241069 n=1 Tax=Vigna radiata var. radiata TaxID=3916 RepID=A0A3Q0EN03_VIGRR|nr:uncharacterized protein LOC111241069 [Vigna radiata var. radiata]